MDVFLPCVVTSYEPDLSLSLSPFREVPLQPDLYLPDCSETLLLWQEFLEGIYVPLKCDHAPGGMSFSCRPPVSLPMLAATGAGTVTPAGRP